MQVFWPNSTVTAAHLAQQQMKNENAATSIKTNSNENNNDKKTQITKMSRHI